MSNKNYDGANEKTISVFDWDDTLLPSTYLTQNHSIDLDDLHNLENLEQQVCRLLSIAVAHGDVYIITNSQEGWVMDSAVKYLPNVVPLLKTIKIISARSTYETHYPGQPTLWKIVAFTKTLNPYFQTEHRNNIIAFGDMDTDRVAFFTATKKRNKTLKKNIKFLAKPNITELNNELKFVIDLYQDIYNYENNLNLVLTINLQTPKSCSVYTASVDGDF